MSTVLEAGVVVSTVGLAYVTAWPYHVRRRFHDRARAGIYRAYVLCRHHGQWILWQVTVIMPRKRG